MVSKTVIDSNTRTNSSGPRSLLFSGAHKPITTFFHKKKNYSDSPSDGHYVSGNQVITTVCCTIFFSILGFGSIVVVKKTISVLIYLCYFFSQKACLNHIQSQNQYQPHATIIYIYIFTYISIFNQYVIKHKDHIQHLTKP